MAVRTAVVARFDDVVDALRVVGERFDQGNFDQAVVLAAHLRGLLRGDDATPALIEMIGAADRLTWVDTAGVPNPKTKCATACLTLMKVGNRTRRGEFVPKLSLYPPAPIRTRDGGHIDRGSRIPFEHWWTNPVLRDVDGGEFTRQDLVLDVAGQRMPTVGASLRASNPVAASVRQITYEVLQSIRQQRNVIDQVPARLAS